MNVNGSRFHLLLGAADWGRCTIATPDGTALMLGDAWAAAAGSPPPSIGLAWDAIRDELRLAPLPMFLPPTPGESPPVPEGRRAAAADAAGNVYRIGDDRTGVLVWSNAGSAEAPFWPDPRAEARHTLDGFAPVRPAPQAGVRFAALAVTVDQYLVAAATDAGSAMLLAFDLAAGGPPVRLNLPPGVFTPFDMAPRDGGGVWVLDRDGARLWEFDTHLAFVPAPGAAPAPAGATDPFQPLNPGPGTPARVLSTASLPPGIDLRAALDPGIDPIAIEVLPGGALALLDRAEPAGRSRVFVLRDGRLAASPLTLPELAQDVVVAGTMTRNASAATLMIVALGGGNQAIAFALEATGVPVRLQSPELYPLRRFGGRALISVRGLAAYDSGLAAPRWVPVVQQPKLAFEATATLTTPVLDGGEPGCVWDRVFLEAVIPPGTGVTIEARAGDDRFDPGGGAAEAVAGPLIEQPRPYLRGDGPELPWLRQDEAFATRRRDGMGTWETLLRQGRGRYLQLRLTLSGPGGATPSIRALRAWYPRFSWPVRFLPAVFREEPVSADFLERFLANLEGLHTALEDRIVQVGALLDARTAPTETLDWLAGWFDIALDPSWDEWRRRLLIRHAMAFFRWRGTVHGLQLALAFAFGQDLPAAPSGSAAEAALFDHPSLPDPVTRRIRIVEAYLTRRIGPLAAGDPGGAGGPREVTAGVQWTPAEGNSGLAERYAATRGSVATPAEQVRPWPLSPPADPALLADWQAFCLTTLGFVPAAGATDRARWQDYLRRRADELTAAPADELTAADGESTAAAGGDLTMTAAGATRDAALLCLLSTRHGMTYTGWDAIDLPADWPMNAALAQDWSDFCAASADVTPLGRWQTFLTSRWRRIGRLNTAWQTNWPSFDTVATPDHLPATATAQSDWLAFERQLLPLGATAHRFSVLLPVTPQDTDADAVRRRMALACRIVEIEKPAHTVFDVRLYWALNQIGSARLGLDTMIGAGSRAPELIPDAVLGRAALGGSFVGGPEPLGGGDRRLLAC